METREGRILSNFLLSNNLEELINEPTHIRDDGSQSCLDLVCTDQPYIFTDTGVMPSLDPHSKHNIIHGSLNFHIPCPPPYKRKVWDYKTAKTNMIRQELSSTNWHSLFLGLNASEMSLVIQNSTNKLINEAERTYYENLGNKLSDPDTGPKHFWTASKRISNKKKQTNIPPIFENNCYVTNFQQKAQIFNDYFAEQCKINDNESLLPEFISKTNASISQINITTNQIFDIIQKHSTKKSHGCDDISVTMLQLCPTEIAVPLPLIFQKMRFNWRISRFLEMRQHRPYS